MTTINLDSVKNQRICSKLVERLVGECVSSLVSHFAANPETSLLGSDYSWEDDLMPLLENREDPSEWTLEQCRDYLTEHGGNEPRHAHNPWEMKISELSDALELEETLQPADTLEALRKRLVEAMDDETVDGLDDWREAARECASENPREVFEHWIVSSWFAGKLKEQGESVGELFGLTIWGRTTTGQAIAMDSVIQQIAANMEILDGQRNSWAD